MTVKFIISHFIKNYDNINDKDVREKYGILSGIIGIIINLMLFIIEIILGIFTNSIAIIADAVHNLADVTSSLVTLIGFKLAGKPADKEHPFGHGRMEYVSALVVSFLILIVGFEFIKSSLQRILHPEPVNFNLITFIIILVAIPLKLWLSHFNKTLGKLIESSTLEATGADSLNDVAILGGVIISLLVSYFTHISIDGYVGMVVAIFILISGISFIKETLNPLLGEAPDPKLVKELRKGVLSYDYISGVHDLIIHNYGPGRTMASLHAEVPCNMPIMKIHDVIDTAEKELSEELDMFIVIHMDPICNNSAEVIKTKNSVIEILKNFPIVKSLHDFRIVGEGKNRKLIFDVVISFDNKISEEEKEILKNNIDTAVREANPFYSTIITVDQDYTH
ncbi:cation diffusion facilitator family transporter [Clostridium pasteurianum]|uniref:Cation diffusion facilitator family transporter n=1 Tax=Clostridium pasteurianum BC1 TaxID=86416 RepID=R4K948_CLOPA|nr:cation diffusion facilitator family transporter [Clostridium pasteurianum]AGK96170.1 cation diffusion facilitator family transporter [Clostridium pasteurianum BC1]